MFRTFLFAVLLSFSVTSTIGAAPPEVKSKTVHLLTVSADLFPALVQLLNPDYADPYSIGLDYVDLFLTWSSTGAWTLTGYDQDSNIVLYDEG